MKKDPAAFSRAYKILEGAVPTVPKVITDKSEKRVEETFFGILNTELEKLKDQILKLPLDNDHKTELLVLVLSLKAKKYKSMKRTRQINLKFSKEELKPLRVSSDTSEVSLVLSRNSAKVGKRIQKNKNVVGSFVHTSIDSGQIFVDVLGTIENLINSVKMRVDSRSRPGMALGFVKSKVRSDINIFRTRIGEALPPLLDTTKHEIIHFMQWLDSQNSAGFGLAKRKALKDINTKDFPDGIAYLADPREFKPWVSDSAQEIVRKIERLQSRGVAHPESIIKSYVKTSAFFNAVKKVSDKAWRAAVKDVTLEVNKILSKGKKESRMSKAQEILQSVAEGTSEDLDKIQKDLEKVVSALKAPEGYQFQVRVSSSRSPDTKVGDGSLKFGNVNVSIEVYKTHTPDGIVG